MIGSEAVRLRAFRDLNLLDTAPNEGFDRITRMACRVLGTPRAAISLTDESRQWFKSRVGGGIEIPRHGAPCAEVTRTGAPLVVADLAADPRFISGALAQEGVRFYAGSPLVTRDGVVLGAMCVMDVNPRLPDAEIIELLAELAAMVMSQVEGHLGRGWIDPVSGLPNRHQLAADLQEMELAHPGEERLAVIFDLAGPIQLAEATRVIGPLYQDGLVNASVRAIKRNFETGRQLYHVGPTQIAAIVSPSQWDALDEKKASIARLQEEVSALGYAAAASISIGLAPFKLGKTWSCELIRAALSAAQDARGQCNIGVNSPSADLLHLRRYAILSGLREALLQEGQLCLHYQPRIDLRTGSCLGAEALLRWHHPTLGTISPSEFVPLAEQTDLVKPMAEWVISTACAQGAAWRRNGIWLRVSANVSAMNLAAPEFAQAVLKILDRNGLPADGLEIEFTESALAKDHSRIRNNLGRLCEAGVTCSIDDFGTGYSSIAYLQEFPVDVIKIDRSFVRLLRTGSRNSILVRNMISMMHDLGYRVVAEGVETKEAYDFLSAHACDEAQGYLIARPMPHDELVSWLKATHPKQPPRPIGAAA